jgi:hypothetical protein
MLRDEAFFLPTEPPFSFSYQIRVVYCYLIRYVWDFSIDGIQVRWFHNVIIGIASRGVISLGNIGCDIPMILALYFWFGADDKCTMGRLTTSSWFAPALLLCWWYILWWIRAIFLPRCRSLRLHVECGGLNENRSESNLTKAQACRA